MRLSVPSRATEYFLLAGLLGTILYSACPAIARKQAAGQTPQECRRTLGFEIPSVATDLSVARDEDAEIVAETIAPLLELPLHDDQQSLFQFLMDSLKSVHGDEMLRRAMTRIMLGEASVGESSIRAGYFYQYFGADIDYPKALAFRSGQPFTQRLWAVEAIGNGIAQGQYSDTTALFAVAAVVCDMAYLLRPFSGDGQSQRYESAAMEQWWVRRADALFTHALANLSIVDSEISSRILKRYLAWEQSAGLRSVAASVISMPLPEG